MYLTMQFASSSPGNAPSPFPRSTAPSSSGTGFTWNNDQECGARSKTQRLAGRPSDCGQEMKARCARPPPGGGLAMARMNSGWSESRSPGESGRDPSKFYIPTFRKSPYRYQKSIPRTPPLSLPIATCEISLDSARQSTCPAHGHVEAVRLRAQE